MLILVSSLSQNPRLIIGRELGKTNRPLGTGFRHPCRNDGFSGFPWLVYNGENSCLGTLILQAPAWPFFGKQELQNPIPKRELGNEQPIPSGCGARLDLLAHPIARQALHSRITFNRTRRKQSLKLDGRISLCAPNPTYPYQEE